MTYHESVSILLGWVGSVNLEPGGGLGTVDGILTEGSAALGGKSDSDHLREGDDLSRVKLGSWGGQDRSQSDESSEKSSELHCLVYLSSAVDTVACILVW